LGAVVEVGAHQMTACTFGREDLRELFIATSRENLAPGEDPAAGSRFQAVPGTAGREVREFVA
jgi:sugar lactone lactonase YvrE